MEKTKLDYFIELTYQLKPTPEEHDYKDFLFQQIDYIRKVYLENLKGKNPIYHPVVLNLRECAYNEILANISNYSEEIKKILFEVHKYSIIAAFDILDMSLAYLSFLPSNYHVDKQVDHIMQFNQFLHQNVYGEELILLNNIEDIKRRGLIKFSYRIIHSIIFNKIENKYFDIAKRILDLLGFMNFEESLHIMFDNPITTDSFHEVVYTNSYFITLFILLRYLDDKDISFIESKMASISGVDREPGVKQSYYRTIIEYLEKIEIDEVHKFHIITSEELDDAKKIVSEKIKSLIDEQEEVDNNRILGLPMDQNKVNEFEVKLTESLSYSLFKDYELHDSIKKVFDFKMQLPKRMFIKQNSNIFISQSDYGIMIDNIICNQILWMNKKPPERINKIIEIKSGYDYLFVPSIYHSLIWEIINKKEYLVEKEKYYSLLIEINNRVFYLRFVPGLKCIIATNENVRNNFVYDSNNIGISYKDPFQKETGSEVYIPIELKIEYRIKESLPSKKYMIEMRENITNA